VTDVLTPIPRPGVAAPIGRSERSVPRHALTSWLAVGLPAAIAVGLCLYDLSARNLWLDEAASLSIASQHGGALGAALAHDGGNMLGYYGLLHVLIGWFGTGPLVLRLPSALGAGATVALVGLLGLRLFGRRSALLAGLLSAVSLTLIYWGQNARAYTLMLALVCASFLCLLWLLQTSGGLWRPGLAYLIVTTAALYAGLEAALILPVQVALLAWYRHRARASGLALFGVVLCVVPLVVLALSRGSGQLFWVPSPSYRTLRQVVQSLGSVGLEPDYYTRTGRWLLFLSLALTLAAAIRVAYGFSSARGRRQAWRGALVLGWLVVPIALTLVVSEIGQSVFQPRYLLVSLPAVALLIGWLLDGIWASTDRLSSGPGLGRLAGPVVALALLAGLLSLRALQVAPSYGKSSEPWRAATQYVVGHSRPSDCVAFYPLDVRMPFRYYLGASASRLVPVLPSLPWSEVRPYVEQYQVPSASSLAALARGCPRVWLVSSHAGEADGPSVSRANLSRYLSLQGQLGSHYPSLSTTRFGYAGLISVTLFSR
jgi:mannosyltransferase